MFYFTADNWDEWTGLEEAGPSYSEPGPSGYEEEYYEPHCEDPDFNVNLHSKIIIPVF